MKKGKMKKGKKGKQDKKLKRQKKVWKALRNVREVVESWKSEKQLCKVGIVENVCKNVTKVRNNSEANLKSIENIEKSKKNVIGLDVGQIFFLLERTKTIVGKNKKKEKIEKGKKREKGNKGKKNKKVVGNLKNV